MKIIKPSFKIHFTAAQGQKAITDIANFGRVCYKSNRETTFEEDKEFIKRIIAKGHESVIEHISVPATIICDRGISHEIVRHRIGSYSQESTRYCNYSKNKFNQEITVIKPCGFEPGSTIYENWFMACSDAEYKYFKLINAGCAPQMARSVLPNSLKTEIVVTYNLREWRHFFRLRTSVKAHPQMREITTPMLREFKKIIPVIFDEIIGTDWGWKGAILFG